jgi:hypothetical protein
MPEEVLRHPEHPDCAWFLSCTDFASDVGTALVHALATLPYQTRLVSLA